MGAIASQITSLTIVHSTVYSDADERKHQRSASLAFVLGIRRGPVSSPHKWPVTRKMVPFDDVIMGMVQWLCLSRCSTWIIIRIVTNCSMVFIAKQDQQHSFTPWGIMFIWFLSQSSDCGVSAGQWSITFIRWIFIMMKNELSFWKASKRPSCILPTKVDWKECKEPLYMKTSGGMRSTLMCVLY